MMALGTMHHFSVWIVVARRLRAHSFTREKKETHQSMVISIWEEGDVKKTWSPLRTKSKTRVAFKVRRHRVMLGLEHP